MATSKLQREVSQMLATYLGQYTIRENIRPDWLITETGGRLELDFYIEEPMVAIEVQGQQHYIFTPHFHKTYVDFEAQLLRDRAKREVCESRGIMLYEIVSLNEAFEIITRICPKVQWPISIKSAQQAERVVFQPDTRYQRREKIWQLFKHHEHIPRKHLRRLLYELLRRNGTSTLVPKRRKRIGASLAALQQYQKTKGIIQFSEREDALLRVAQVLIGR